VLAETDIRNKDKIAQRKSLYAQLSGQVEQLTEALKDKDGTIETLERQVVQAGIKNKVMQGAIEINKSKEQIKGDMREQYLETEAKQKLLRGSMANEAATRGKEMQLGVKNVVQDAKNNLRNNNKE
jgi:hypothetical protein